MFIRLASIFSIAVFLLSPTTQTAAYEMQSPNFRLKGDDISIISTPTKKSISQNNETTTSIFFSRLEEETFNRQGYVLLNDDFSKTSTTSLKIDNSILTYDNLSQLLTEEQFTTITIQTEPTWYSLFLTVEKQSDDSKSLIPTTCNVKKSECSPLKAAPWTSTQITGYGFRVDGQIKPIDFINNDYYRSFPPPSKPIEIFTYNKNSLKFGIKINLSPTEREKIFHQRLIMTVIPQL